MIKKLLLAAACLLAITQNTNAQCTATVTGNTFACYGTTSTLYATSGGVTYQWYDINTPIPGATTDQYTPNSTGYYSVKIDFGGCVDSSIAVYFVQGSIFYVNFINPDTMICAGDTLAINAMAAGGNGPYVYNWTGPGYSGTNQNVLIPSSLLTHDGMYHINIADNLGCIASDSIYISVLDCDSVWPGDVNYDLIADNNDVLDLALAYGSTGSARTGASNSWIAQYSAAWNTIQTCGAGMKHADCNGDGTVDADDTTAISLNYGQMHLKGEHHTQAKSTADPDLYFDITGVNFIAGTTVTIPIKLGTSALPMNNILGIAADIKVAGIILVNPPTISATTSWMGSTADLLNFTKGVGTNQTDWTLARTDHSNVSGDGTIATLTMDIPAGSEGQDAILYFSGVKIIDNNGIEITNYNIVDDTATITLTVANAGSIVEYVAIAPNPSDAQANLHLSLQSASPIRVIISDITGRKVETLSVNAVSGTQQIALPAAQLAPGIYNVHITDDKGTVNNNLKWVKK